MADPEEGPRGSGRPPLLFLDLTEAEKKFFFGDPPPPYLNVLDDRAPSLSQGMDPALLSVSFLSSPASFFDFSSNFRGLQQLAQDTRRGISAKVQGLFASIPGIPRCKTIGT